MYELSLVWTVLGWGGSSGFTSLAACHLFCLLFFQEGLTAEEIASREPEESERMQVPCQSLILHRL